MAGPSGSVVYLCTFSKSLAPSIRIACMVLPPALLEGYRKAFGSYSSTVSRFEQPAGPPTPYRGPAPYRSTIPAHRGRFEQQTLRWFLEGGYFTRHLARMRSAYKNRMERLAAALEDAFGRENIRLKGQHTGLHLLLTLPGGPGEAAMASAALAEGVKLKGLSEYYMERQEECPENSVILGYASLQDGDIPALAAALKQAWGGQDG